jgi:membrane associated rhomboid family serine protease
MPWRAGSLFIFGFSSSFFYAKAIMNNLYITDVVKHLIIINVIVFIGTNFMGGPTGDITEFNDWGSLRFAVFYPTSEFFRPFQVVTYMFMHGGVAHIFFNMYALYMFGTAIETVWGPKRFLFYYLFTGFGALALQFFVQYIEIQSVLQKLADQPIEVQEAAISAFKNTPMLGASGAVFGILAAYGMQFPNNVLTLLFPPVSMKAKYFVLIYAALEIGLGLSPYQTGVAHFAHVGGALFGFLLIMYWRKRGERMY